MGDAMNYWKFFPAEEPWGCMPVWGYANVVASQADGVPEGTRVFGYFPSASHLVVRPDRPSETDFVDATPHRQELPAAYNRYLRSDGNEMYEEKNEDYEILLWPLYFTSFLIDDFLDDEGMFGAGTAILSSASSRTSSALAYLLGRRDGIEVVGLTSPRNVEFTESLGVYDKVVPYENLDSLERQPAVYVDMSRRRQGAQRGARPLRRRAQALGRGRNHPPGGSRRRLRAGRPEPSLLLRPGPPQEAHRGLGSRRASTSGSRTPGAPTSTGLAGGFAWSTARAQRTWSASTGRCSTASRIPLSGTCCRPATERPAQTSSRDSSRSSSRSTRRITSAEIRRSFRSATRAER